MTSRFEPTHLRPSAAPYCTRNDAGFTLIEVIVTLTILGLSLALITGYRAPWSGGLGLRGTATELAYGLRLARSEAILGNRPVAFALDPVGHRYQVGAAAPRRLPTELRIELLTIAGERGSGALGGIRFNPDGTSTGGRITIGDGKRTIAVGIDWLSGRVVVADAK